MWRNERPVIFASWTATPPVLVSSYSDTVGFTSMSVQSSGRADYNYGTASVASLQVWPSTLDLKGRLLAFGRNPADASPGLLTRYNVDGHWDESTGHVVDVANLPDEALIIKEIVGATSNGSQTYFSARGRPNVCRLHVYRLTRSGGFNSAFDNEGRPDRGPDLRTANRLFATGHGTHIVML